ncbi:MAG: hypothetical protein KGQ37_11600 [Hyphomicrobiales bacterium]|nr:hypothetical protein [Hyphomicrobiales bacterium]
MTRVRSMPKPGQPEYEPDLFSRASSLVNPKSGIANDYLNVLNEISMLVENYPAMPEFYDSIVGWKTTGYTEYFRNSNLPGRDAALKSWEVTRAELREAFETLIHEVETLASRAKSNITSHAERQLDDEAIESICADLAESMRACILRATHIINNGTVLPQDDAQARADAIMQNRLGSGRRKRDRG